MDFEQLVLSTDELNTLRVIAQEPVDQTALAFMVSVIALIVSIVR